jgi:2,5-diketo-D-gluconate reductase A
VSAIPSITLNDGNIIPQLGFGVFQIDPEDTVTAVSEALEIGYRHIDTAEMYGNEKEVGEAIRSSGLDRGEVFVTSKLSNGAHEPRDAREAFDRTLAELDFDYVDLFLIHWPLPTRYGGDFVSTWKTLEEFHADGRVRSIGVSNFQVEHLRRLAAETDTVPAVNQIEVHPYLTNETVRTYGRVQRGDIVFPKSVTPSRIKENFEIFDFELISEDMDAITALDRGEEGRTGAHPDKFDYVPS